MLLGTCYAYISFGAQVLCVCTRVVCRYVHTGRFGAYMLALCPCPWMSLQVLLTLELIGIMADFLEDQLEQAVIKEKIY